MCFSPEADFAAAAVVGAIGVVTLRRVRTRRELIVGALPLLFALHQLTEGFVWLGLRGDVSTGLGDAARDVYVLYAFAILPLIVPIGFLLLEPVARYRRRIVPFVALGAGVGLYLLWQVTQHPVEAVAHPRGIAYSTHATGGYALALAYVVATCGPALLSSRRYLRWFGVINLGAAVLAAAVHEDEFESIWCLYAALASILILEHFRRQRAEERRDVRPTGPLEAVPSRP
jgi:uncharacterized protein DUF6629